MLEEIIFMKTQAIILESQGGPEVMQLKTIEVMEPSEGEILIEQTAIGLNYMDVYQRSGFYKMQTPMHLKKAGASLLTFTLRLYHQTLNLKVV